MKQPQATWVAEDALLVRWEADSPSGVSLRPQLAFHEIRRQRLPEIADLIPGACTLLVCLNPATPERRLAELERSILACASRAKAGAKPVGRVHEIRMRYDGEDLEFVAGHLRLSVASCIRWHSSTPFRVAFMGFAPGFPYLIPTEGGVEIPRLPEPRVRVPGGSVALAGPFCGIYPHSTSGGWRWIGSSDVSLFDPARRRPSLLGPGDTVRFVTA